MDDTNKMLRAIMNGQSAMKAELLGKIEIIDEKIDRLDKKIDSVKLELKNDLKKLTKRINVIGLSEARLEDDTPTREEFDKLERKVDILSKNIITA